MAYPTTLRRWANGFSAPTLFTGLGKVLFDTSGVRLTTGLGLPDRACQSPKSKPDLRDCRSLRCGAGISDAVSPSCRTIRLSARNPLTSKERIQSECRRLDSVSSRVKINASTSIPGSNGTLTRRPTGISRIADTVALIWLSFSGFWKPPGKKTAKNGCQRCCRFEGPY